MIKAGSLFYAIVISLIISLITGSLIMFAYLSRIQFQRFDNNQRLNLNAESGLNLLLSKQNIIELNEQKNIDLFNIGMDSVQLTRKAWGAYEIAISRAVSHFSGQGGGAEVFRIAQIGYYPDSAKSYSLYLTDLDKPLALCGETKIKGTAYLPKAGVKRAYIEGQSFTGNELIQGSTKTSEKQLPTFNKKLIENIQNILSTKTIANDDSTIAIQNELTADTLTNAFQNRTLVFTSTTALKINAGTYSGNIAFISEKQITISADAILKDVLIYAPKVIVEKGFKGNLQLFASDSIGIDENVILQYPSVIGLLTNDHSPKVASIVLNENDTIEGNVFVNKQESKLNPINQAGLTMHKKAMIYGQVYSNGFADIQGSIYGSLMCNKIILSTPSSVYENHLLNATIDNTKLSKHFVGINLVEESTVKKVLKWLN